MKQVHSPKVNCTVDGNFTEGLAALYALTLHFLVSDAPPGKVWFEDCLQLPLSLAEFE